MAEPPVTYCSQDMDELFIKVSEAGYRLARSIAASDAEEWIPGFGRSRYVGRRLQVLHDHEDWEYCETCPEVEAWCFEIYEGSPR